jgi:exonuclease VII large subunit
LAREDRKRKKSEELYIILIAIGREYDTMFNQFIRKVMFNTPAEAIKHEIIPNSLKLEMLVSLYFSELDDAYDDFIKARDVFIDQYYRRILEDYSGKSIDEQNQICDNAIILQNGVRDTIKLMQIQLAISTKL